MKLAEEPKFAEPSREVILWLEERVPHASTGIIEITALREKRDAPPYVLAWLDAREEWRLAHEAWSASKPIDYDHMGARWRIFGGDWLPSRSIVSTVLEADWDGCRYVVVLHDSIVAAYARMTEDEFRAYAAGVYEHIRARDAACVALVKHLRNGEGL